MRIYIPENEQSSEPLDSVVWFLAIFLLTNPEFQLHS